LKIEGELVSRESDGREMKAYKINENEKNAIFSILFSLI